MEKLGSRRSRSDGVISPELGRALTESSREIGRQVALLIDRQGHIRHVVVGDARSVFLPDISSYRRGPGRLCGLRLVHTHLNGEPLSDDDLTDLALLRLDCVAVVAALEDGLPGDVQIAQIVPGGDNDAPWHVGGSTPIHDLPEDFLETVSAIEEEFARQVRGRQAGQVGDRAILVHVTEGPTEKAAESLRELKELGRSAGIDAVEEIIQRRRIDARNVLGKGKLRSVVIRAMQLGVEIIVFDHNLSPAQVKNIADFTDLKVLDRTQVILDIFAQHAQTREGKIQVELAQLRYLLPRLSTKHTAMSRLTGGIGGRGPGETKLEVDRRRAKDRITQLAREVVKLGERRKLRRRQRTRGGLPVVSIVGYTNAGKSTLLNKLTASNVTAEDALFATLNPVSRRLRFPREREIIITDTVGFIRDLPDDLMAAFRTTFEELDEANLLLHVVDASAVDVEERINVVHQLLHKLGFDRTEELIVLNKQDRCEEEILRGLALRYDGVPISALEEDTLGTLLERMESVLWREVSARL